MTDEKNKFSLGIRFLDSIVRFREDEEGLRSYGRLVFLLWIFSYVVVYLVSFDYLEEDNRLVLHLVGGFFTLAGLPMVLGKAPRKSIFYFHMTQMLLLPLLPFILHPVFFNLSSMSSILTLLMFLVLLFARYVATEKRFSWRELLALSLWSFATSTYLSMQYGTGMSALPLYVVVNLILHLLILLTYELVNMGLVEHLEKKKAIMGLEVAHELLEKRSEEEKGLLEEELFQARKMEALGQLAGGIAHDFNNVLASISGYADLIKKRFGDGNEDLQRYVGTILNASERASGLISQLLAYARKGKYQKRVIDMHQMIESVLGLLEPTLGKSIRMYTSTAAEPPTIMGDPDQVQNALINLSINARDAMPEGGSLSFHTEVTWIDEKNRDLFHFKVEEGEYLLLEVTDTGTGMDTEIQKKIFEPFFTTKGAGKGTGLGLAGVYGCVKSHKACILVNSEIGKGTTFSIYWPLVREENSVLPKESAEELTNTEKSSSRRRGNILVIDDESAIREMVVDMLGSAGFEVQQAEDGVEGLKLYRKMAGEQKIDLVLLDMIMPRMDGKECFQRLQVFDKNVRVLLFSGFSTNEKIQGLLDAGATDFLQKPFTYKLLLHKVDGILAGKSAEKES